MGLNEWGQTRYVQLETNEFIQIKFIQRVILDGDKFLVVHSDRLSLFDKDGKYQYDIGEKEKRKENISEWVVLFCEMTHCLS